MSPDRVDRELHKSSAYRIPYVKKQFKKIHDKTCTYIELNEKCWDGYNAAPITLETIKKSHKVLDTIFEWLEDNIGFLNNRRLDIDCSPYPDGEINIEIIYTETFEFNVTVGEKETSLDFAPYHIHFLDGEHTIADRHVDMRFPKDRMLMIARKFSDIKDFLQEAFYEHKWKFDYENTLDI